MRTTDRPRGASRARWAGAVVAVAASVPGCASSDSGVDAPGGRAGSDPATTATTAAPPPLDPALAVLADRTAMTSEARDVFARAEPQLVDAATLRTRCTVAEETNVLGCYAEGRIAVLDISDPRLDGMEETTAAHELLHAVWQSTPAAERERLGVLLRAVYEASTDLDLRDKVEAYRRRDPAVVDNELHSILGTEVATLDPELEEHYRRWLVSRSTVVTLAASAQAAFDDLEAQIRGLDGQLEVLGSEIATAEAELDTSRAALDVRSAELDALRSAGLVAAYNAGVDPYNAAVQRHNDAVAAQRARVERYNGTVAIRNALGADYQELADEITTRATPVG